jgi:hypothetical protein
MKSAKVFIAILLAVLMAVSFALPTLASVGTIGTNVTLNNSGTLPSVLAKWEQDTTASLENGDPSHTMYVGTPTGTISNSQFLPPVSFNGTKTIQYYAVVDDQAGLNAISDVAAFVYSPINAPWPYNANPNAPTGISGLFKYKVELYDLEKGTNAITNAAAKSLYDAASAAHLITTGNNVVVSPATVGTPVVSSYVSQEIGQGVYHLYMGTADLTYEQPAGDYTVDMYVTNTSNATSALLENHFNYVAVPAFLADFTSINYGPVGLNQPKPIPGDETWDNPAGVNHATLRNIGNVWASPVVSQDDMGFGTNNLGIPNVSFDARLGGTDIKTGIISTDTTYYPQFKLTNSGRVATGVAPVVLPNFLGLSMDEKFDTSILITNTVPGITSYIGTMTINAQTVPFGTGGVGTAFGPIGILSPGAVLAPGEN